MVRLKKPASDIRALSRAKPATQSDTDDPSSVADDQRKTKATGGQRRGTSGTQRSSKKPAPQPRHNMTDEDVDGDGIDEEDDGEDNNDRNDGNDPVEDNDEENDNPGNNTERPNTERVNDDDQEQKEEETYKQAEIQLLKAKMKLLLIEKMKKEPGKLGSQDVRSERRLKSEVRKLREQLAEETEEPAPAAGEKKNSDASEKDKPVRNKQDKSDPSRKLWSIHGIIKETTYHYLVVWKGADENGQPWDDWWVAKREVNAAAKRDWAALRASESKDRRKKREKWEKFERAKAQKRASSKGQDPSEDGDEDDDEDTNE